MNKGFNKSEYRHLKYKMMKFEGLSSEEADKRLKIMKEWIKKNSKEAKK